MRAASAEIGKEENTRRKLMYVGVNVCLCPLVCMQTLPTQVQPLYHCLYKGLNYVSVHREHYRHNTVLLREKNVIKCDMVALITPSFQYFLLII